MDLDTRKAEGGNYAKTIRQFDKESFFPQIQRNINNY